MRRSSLYRLGLLVALVLVFWVGNIKNDSVVRRGSTISTFRMKIFIFEHVLTKDTVAIKAESLDKAWGYLSNKYDSSNYKLFAYEK